jgi:G3E family GTPase
MSLFDRDKSGERIPVSLITGFLGSGKTTLLNRLLRHPAMADSAVIINEFGEVGLDHLLVEAVEGEVAVLASGCICCTMRSDLEETLRGLLARRDRAEVPPFQRVLVETTGLADPAPIVQLLLHNPLLGHFVRLDAIVTTVDAVHGERQLDAHAEAVKQVAIADRLLLTKTDIADTEAIGPLRARLARLNPAAAVTTVHYGDIVPDRLFSAALFDPERKSADVRRWLNAEAYSGHDHSHDHAHDHGHPAAPHDPGINAFCLTFEDPLDWMTVSGWLAKLRALRGQHLLRVKGILNLAGENAPVAIHGVHHVFHPPVLLNAWTDEDRRSRIVFITRDLERADVEASWRNYRAAAEGQLAV